MAEPIICKFCEKPYLEPCDNKKADTCPNYKARLERDREEKAAKTKAA